MLIVDVIPFSRGMQKEMLSYFTAKPVSIGDIALVPLHKKEIPALVVRIKDAARAKSELKRSLYGLRKITRVISSNFFHPAFVGAAEKSAAYFASSVGAIIESYTPKIIFDALQSGALSHSPQKTSAVARDQNSFESFAFQASPKDRMTAYKGIIREEFAKDRSVLFLHPTIDDIPDIVSTLGKGIENRIYAFHSGLPKKILLRNWHEILREPRPVCIVGTGMSLAVPREDIGTILVEHEESWSYKQERRPFCDTRVFARHVAEARGARYIAGATMLSVETLYRRERGEISDFVPPVFHVLSSADISIVDMKHTHSPLQLTPKTFIVIGNELQQSIEAVRTQNQHIFLFSSRRGLYPITVCGDCGTAVLCTECAAPLVLHKKTAKTKGSGGAAASAPDTAHSPPRVFLCHTCRKTNAVTDRCASCNSWRLAPLGIGVERVEEEVRRLFPTIHIARVDKDKTPTRALIKKTIASFLESPGSVLIGTEVALAALKKKIAVTAAVSIDPIFALPSFRIHERAFHILLSLREKANEKCIIQTRLPDLPLFKYAQTGNIADFYKEEKAARHAFNYPPYTALIKLTASGTKENVEKIGADIKQHLRDYDVFVFPAFIAKMRKKYILHAVIKIKQDAWPDEKLRALLSELPLSVTINVDPEHLL